MNSSTDKDHDTDDEELAEAADSSADESSSTAGDAVFDDSDLVAEPPRRPRLPLLASLAALVLAVLALAGTGWNLVTSGRQDTDAGANDAAARIASTAADVRRLRSTVDELTADRDSARLTIAALEERIAQMAASNGTVAADVDSLQRRLEQRLDLIDSVPARVASMERAVSALRGISTGAEDAWLLSQAEYFLQVANAELELSRNAIVAEKALKMADERLVSLDDPGLTDIRRELSAEIQSLEAIAAPDIAGTAVTLASLSRIVDSLPIREGVLNRRPETPDESEPLADEELSGVDRAWSTLVEAMSGAIDIRRTDEAARPLMAPEAVYFLRANLSLQLQAARLALLTGEQALFEQSLDDAIAWLDEYYDTGSTPVQGALATMKDIRGSQIVGNLPDISTSLRLLRQYIAFSAADTDEPPAAETEPAQ